MTVLRSLLLATFLVSLNVSAVVAGTVGDINNDGKIDLTEAIHALQVATGTYPNLDPSCQLVGKYAWTSGADYAACDVVNINAIYYVCISAHQATNDFLADAAYWELLTLLGNWQKIGNDIHFTDGNVGIGTSTPQSALEVDGIVHSTSGGVKFPDDTVQTTAPSLQCYTATMQYDNVNPGDDFCTHTPVFQITNPYPSTTAPSDVFDDYCASPSPFDSTQIVVWGLRCKEGWINTGCEGSMSGADSEDGTAPFLNGCHMDDEEYDSSTIFTTCCRIAPSL
ncbi:MAG: hypothetical protein GY702_10100 [Desulfobulbaceae bacterium]|nr:hypothetical protein [Desulfobulbaceae bacterium]